MTTPGVPRRTRRFLELERFAEAAALLEQARPLAEADADDPGRAAWIRFLLAQAVAPEDPARGLAEARAARAALQTAVLERDAKLDEELAAVDAWLDAQPEPAQP